MRRIADLQEKFAPTKFDPIVVAKDLAKEGVVLDEAKGHVSFKLRTIMRDRPLECVAINDGGPGHESLFRTHVRPSALRLALLTLGLEKGKGADLAQSLLPAGSKVYLYVTWPGLASPYRVEDALLNASTGQTMTGASWVFAGSEFVMDFKSGRDIYIPDENRVAIALTYNWSNAAVIACNQADAANEQIWAPNPLCLPDSAEVEVTMIIAKAENPEWEMRRPTSAPTERK